MHPTSLRNQLSSLPTPFWSWLSFLQIPSQALNIQISSLTTLNPFLYRKTSEYVAYTCWLHLFTSQILLNRCNMMPSLTLLWWDCSSFQIQWCCFLSSTSIIHLYQPITPSWNSLYSRIQTLTQHSPFSSASDHTHQCFFCPFL